MPATTAQKATKPILMEGFLDMWVNIQTLAVGWDQIRDTRLRVGERRPTIIGWKTHYGGPALADHAAHGARIWSHPTVLSVTLFLKRTTQGRATLFMPIHFVQSITRLPYLHEQFEAGSIWQPGMSVRGRAASPSAVTSKAFSRAW